MKEMRKKIQSDLNESKKQMRKRCELVLREQKQELIGEFLRDWRWGNILENHMYKQILVRNCGCPHPKQIYWRWFEKKWEERKDG